MNNKMYSLIHAQIKNPSIFIASLIIGESETLLIGNLKLF